MAKKISTKKASAPTHLTLRLNAPGMTPMHRAGLGGLAATLRNLEFRHEQQNLHKQQNLHRSLFTDNPLWHDEFSWKITPTEVTLNFGKPEWAGDFFKWLFQFAFQIDTEKMIFLPGQYPPGNPIPPAEVRARLQSGLTLTFLQHGKTRTLRKEETTGSYEHDGKALTFTYKQCQKYAHQKMWESWINNKGNNKGELSAKGDDVQGPIYPGAVVRHNAFAGPTKVSQPIELVLPLAFAMVGTLTLPINRAVGALVVPYVDDLESFAKQRPRVTPKKITETFVASSGDAVLRFEIQLEGHRLSDRTNSPGCDVVLFRPMPWSTQQKSRSSALSVASIDKDFLDFYRAILRYFSPRIREKKPEKKTGRGKDAVTTVETEYFWTDSVIRPFIADNIVANRYWFSGFTTLMNSKDPVSDTPMRQKIAYEREGLNKMINDETLDWKLEGARSLVLAVHEALRCCYGKIGSEKGLTQQGTKNRLEREYEKWRLAFSGSKTQEQFRYSLSDMFSRAKAVPELKTGWDKIMQLVLTDWQVARDLALIGLASYSGKGAEPVPEETPEETPDTEE
jgi:CRISPR-associated protein Cas8a1/Csx13